MDKINYINVFLILIFFIPLIKGASLSISRESVYYSINKFLDNLQFLFGIFAAIYFTKKIFFTEEDLFFRQIYLLIPLNIREFFYGKDIVTYIIAVPFISILITIVIKLIMLPFNRLIYYFCDSIYHSFNKRNQFTKKILGALSQLPKAVILTLIIGIVMNFHTYFFHTALLEKQIDQSSIYQALYKNVLYPALNSNIAKKIPVIINDSFSKSTSRISSEDQLKGDNFIRDQLSKRKLNDNPLIVEYFNGVTLDVAIKSNEDIDTMAQKIVGSEKNTKKKAKLLYNWISQNIKYDYEKAKRISESTKGTSSGAIIAFNTRTGICFDYSCLYVAMCKSVGLKVRLVTGMAYSGVAWGDHAWNQAYFEEEARWANIDTTFGSTANYFDKSDFQIDHKYDDIQGDW